MKTYFSIAVLVYLLSYWICYGAEPPVQRQAWTTNFPGAHDAFGTNCTHTNLYTLGRIFAAGPLGTNQVVVGHETGIMGSNSVGIGYQAGMSISNGNSAVVIGRAAGAYPTNAVNATIIGGWAAQRAMHASNATVVGAYAGWMATNIENATLIGRSSGIYATNAPYATMVGARSGADVVNAPYATFIGYAADSAVGPSNIQRSVAIGYEAKVTNTNQFILGTGQYVGINTNAPAAQLHVNGSSLINGSITNTGNIDMLGTSNQIRMANNQGIISYDQADDTLWLSNAFNGTSLSLGGDIYSSWGTRYSGNGSGLTNLPGNSITGLLSGTIITSPIFTNVTVYESDAYHVPLTVWATNSTLPGLIVNSNGFVGINTNNPLNTLTVAGSIRSASNYGPPLNDWLLYGDENITFDLDNDSTTAAALFNIRDSANKNLFVVRETPGTWINGMLNVSNLVTDGNTDIDISNDAQTWRMNVQGSPAWMGNDDFRIVDVTDSSAVALGIDAGDQVVYIPGGLHSTNSIGATVLGVGAGTLGQGTNGTALGYYAGANSSNINLSTIVGYGAGFLSVWAPESQFLGYYSGASTTNAAQSSFIGNISGRYATNCFYSVFNGYNSGYKATNCYYSVFQGHGSGAEATNAYESVFTGYNAGRASSNDFAATFFGSAAGSYSRNCYRSTIVGLGSGLNAVGSYNSIFIGAYAGTNTVRPNTLLIDAAYQGTNALIYGEFDNGMVRINNRLQVYAPSNGVAPLTKVNQPIGLFGSMMMTVTNTVTMASANVYYTLTNWTTIRTNGFSCDPGWGKGFLTNQYSGFYRISGSVSAIPATASEMFELEVFLDETGKEEIASFGQYDNPARVRTLPLTGGVLYIPAGTGISLRVANRTAAHNLEVWRASLTVGTP